MEINRHRSESSTEFLQEQIGLSVFLSICFLIELMFYFVELFNCLSFSSPSLKDFKREFAVQSFNYIILPTIRISKSFTTSIFMMHHCKFGALCNFSFLAFYSQNLVPNNGILRILFGILLE